MDLYFEGDITHIWTKRQDGSTRHYPLAHHPRIYVAADEAADQYTTPASRTLEEIRPEIAKHPLVVSVSIVDCYLSSSHDQPTTVCRVEILSPNCLDEVVADFRAKRYNLFNIDLNPRQQFFLDTLSFPMGACHIKLRPSAIREYSVPEDARELDYIEMYDDPTEIYYRLPPLRIMDITLEINHSGPFPEFKDTLANIQVTIREFERDEENVQTLQGSESEILLQLVKAVHDADPDFINVVDGDKFVLNYLAHRAAANELTDRFVIGRLELPLYPRKNAEGNTYMTYGQIMRRDPVWYLPGRVHIDAENSFFMYEAGLAGLVDLSRMGGVPPERTSRSSIGSALTGIEFQINAATLPATLVPPNKAKGEQFKPIDQLLIADNGGLIYPARPGVHDRVWAIDFTSLYPMIMARHNIGSETVLCPHDECKTGVIVPEVEYHVCQYRVGVVPKTMFMVLQKRLLLKLAKQKETNTMTQNRFKGIDSAMKWILVSCFGYLGFKNARWGSIESHQCVTAFARRYLLQARLICERLGYEVLGGITDSLFIRARDKSSDTPAKIEHLVATVTRETGIPLDTEGRFQWLVFCNIRDYTGVSALNRYFGFFDHGEFKLRGIKHRQRRACELEKGFQEAILEHLAAAQTIDEFKALIPSANQILLQWKQRLLDGKVDPRDLIIKLKSTRGVDGYRATSTVQALTVKKYQQLGKEIQAGQSFYYMVKDDSVKTTDRITIGPNVSQKSTYDPEFYCKMLEDDFLELLEAPQNMLFGEIKYDGNLYGIMSKLDDFFDKVTIH